MRSDVDTNPLLAELRKQTILWEAAPPGSRMEYEAAEAASRSAAELDAALCEGADLPVEWQRAQQPDPPVAQAPASVIGGESGVS